MAANVDGSTMEEVMTAHVGVLVGSLHKNSLTRKVATALGELAPETLRLEIISRAVQPGPRGATAW